MRDLRDKLFPLSAVFLAVLVLVVSISILFRLADHGEVLTGPPDLYVTIDDDPFFLQEASSKWNARLGMTRSMGGEGHGHEATEKDEIRTSVPSAYFDFGDYPPASISATFSESLTGKENPARFEDNRLYFEDGLWIYTVTAAWESENYNGKASYSLRINTSPENNSTAATPAPPPLELTIDGTVHKISSGTYSWQAGQQHILADSDHPLCLTYDQPVITSAAQMDIRFGPMPDAYELYCWPVGTAIDDEGNSAVEAIVLLPHNDRIPLQEGQWIYQLNAEWTDTGEASYAFRIDRAK